MSYHLNSISGVQARTGVHGKLVFFFAVILCMIWEGTMLNAQKSPSSGRLLFVGDFESGDLSGWRVSGNPPQVTTEPVRAGRYAMKTVLDRYHDRVSYRTEVSGPGGEVGEEYWYGFSIFLPDDYRPDAIWEIVAQWHGVPDFDIGETWRNPVMALSTDGGVWRLINRWDAKRNTYESGKKVYGGSHRYDLGAYQTGVWTDWVFHVKWSYGEDGLLDVWQNGKRLIHQTGPNTFNDAKGPYFKMGIYKGWRDPNRPSDAVSRRVLYHDEFRMGSADATYEDVAPGGQSATESDASDPEAAAEAELQALRDSVKAFKVIALSLEPGEIVIQREDSLTIDNLRDVPLDANPPVLREPSKPYAQHMTDDFPPGEAPYVAKGIRPFRFRYFNCEFNYGGWHNFAMTDYVSAHGFNILYPYTRTVEKEAHLPEGTRWMNWGGFIDWLKWFEEHHLPQGRYDILVDMDLVAIHLAEDKFSRVPQTDRLSDLATSLMIDMEHSVLPPERLREQDWYPREAGLAKRAAFEKRYYDGYAQTYISAIQAARKQGWDNISLYGWAPYGRTWGGLERPEAAPGEDFAWNAFGKSIYDATDIINNSVYCFYWSPNNVAYVLANIDSNMRFVNAMPERKPVRPYFWTLLHGGGGGWRWWRGQPLANEEQRAMTAAAFFTGGDGLVLWNWSGTGNHHLPPPLKSDADVMLKEAFDWRPEDASADARPQSFRRYDVLHLLDVDEEKQIVRFQRIQPEAKDRGIGPEYPAYVMPVEQLKAHLRASSEPVAAMIEGMALVKPLEYLLRHGEVKIDVPAREQFQNTLPIMRRIKLGKIHVILTYDPAVIYGGDPRTITLKNFDGHRGLTLKLPADSETRIVVLKERS